jgi:hypothetical protein
MIREGQGFVYERRSLRHVFGKVPTFSLKVKVIFVLEIPATIQCLASHLLV